MHSQIKFFFFFQWAFHFWKIDLTNFRDITDYLKSCCKGESVKKAKTFDQDDLNRFLEAPIVKTGFSKHAQVRSVAATVMMCGGNRCEEVKG